MAERRLQRAQTALDEARRLIDRRELRRAAERLERARADFAAELSLHGVREVRAEAERGYQQADEADEPFYEQLLYASAQNVRFLSRRDAARRGVEWVDPHPELDLPGRPEIRVERLLDRRTKRWLGGLAALVVAAGLAVLAYYAATFESATLVNDQNYPVTWGSCNDGTGPDSGALLQPGARKHLGGWHLCVELMTNAGLKCVRPHDGETMKVSEAPRCRPGF